MSMHHVVNYSGGLSSHLAAKYIVDEVGRENVTLLFCDTMVEDADLYRFVREGGARLGAHLIWVRDGRTIWEVMRDERFLANTRLDPCSKILKRQIAERTIERMFGERPITRVYGYSSCEAGRLERTQKRFTVQIRAPLVEEGIRSADVRALFEKECPELKVPRLYDLGAPHNNCGGLCVKAGQKQFAWALRVIPEVYAKWEHEEQQLRDQLGDVSILRDRRGGPVKPMTLSVFRKRIEEGAKAFEAPGDDRSCACFEDNDQEGTR